MSPAIAVPNASISAIASTAARTISGASASGRLRRAAITPRIQSTNVAAGGTSPRRYDSSRCVCALTRPGKTATFPSERAPEPPSPMSPMSPTPPLRTEPRVLDVAHDLRFVHAVACTRGADDVFFDHDAAHVVRAIGEAQLADLAALRHPRRLQVVEVVEHQPGNRERPQVIDAG